MKICNFINLFLFHRSILHKEEKRNAVLVHINLYTINSHTRDVSKKKKNQNVHTQLISSPISLKKENKY